MADPPRDEPQRIYVPTRLERQRTASAANLGWGEPKGTYPWGGDRDPRQEPWRANTRESELNRSTAVGLYPRGASPAGALDMAGTVWEWCLNAFEEPDNIGPPKAVRIPGRCAAGPGPTIGTSRARPSAATTSAFGFCVRHPSSGTEH